MEQVFSALYRFFKKHKPFFWMFFFGLLVLLAWGASRVRLEEDITRFFPDDERVERLNYVYKNSKFVERLVVMVSVKDSAIAPQPDSLISFAGELINRIETDLAPHIKQVSGAVADEKVMELFQAVQDHLPVFLEEKDYVRLDSLTRPEVARRVLHENYRQLISPAGIAIKNIIVNDPMGFSFLALAKLRQLQYDENFVLYDNYIVTKDYRHLLFFIQPAYAPSETGNNVKFLAQLNDVIAQVSPRNDALMTSYFGGAVVATGNAQQLQQDTLLTVSIMLVLLMVVLMGFFRRKRVPFLILIPVAFGFLFALCCVALIQSSLSILALAVGAIILGIGVDYSLHFLVHLKHIHHTEQVIKELAKPLTMGSITTVLAFFCLGFTNASVLRDIGLFAGFSLSGAALCTLILLPHFIGENLLAGQPAHWVDRLSAFSFESNKTLVYAILLLTPVFFYFADDVKFNSDMNKLNFMTPETRAAQHRLESINNASLSSIYVVASGKSMEEALRKNEATVTTLQRLKGAGLVNKFSSVSSFLLSDSLQRVRINRWNTFWHPVRQETLRRIVQEEGARLNFSPTLFQNFDRLLARTYKPVESDATAAIRKAFFDDYIIDKDSAITVITLANVHPNNKTEVYQQLEAAPSRAFDRQMLTNLFVEYVNADFSFIVTFTSVFVFFALLISYGRIEITLMTFAPMLLTWIWILGIMALLNIEFNIVNVMVSTFIFGLGDDYSIFIMDGLKEEYRAGKKGLPAIRTSIFLSAVTTICGLGVLIFAKHPALQSIAAISIIGIVCVYIMSQTIEPFLFRLLISHRAAKGHVPMTAWGICKSVLVYAFFVSGSFLLTAIGILLKMIPFARRQVRFFYHTLIRFFTWSLVYLAAHLKKKIIGKSNITFSRAAVIISNHSSFMDILLTTMLHPRLVLLTNKWVWNSPIFGGVVRLADYYPVMEGAEDSVDRLADRVAEGYSVVVFPEGTRTVDGKMKRFHKGAFYMAEALRLPVQPLLIHGANEAIRKGDFYVNDSYITLKFLPAIAPEDDRFGVSYAERAKKISAYFKAEHKFLALQEETPDYFAYKLISNYRYKGPVLEWYMRIKLKLEKNYAPFHDLVPRRASVLDLGCGYGFLCYMLQFLSEERVITGVDYDAAKIETAQHGYLRSDRLQFHCDDVTVFPLQRYDVIIISDVLHYLSPAAQERLLVRCFEALHPGGKLIIRDGNADLKERHKGTRLTEFFSVKVLKFNKSEQPLNFISGRALGDLAIKYGLTVTVQDETKYTSNVIFVIEKKLVEDLKHEASGTLKN